MLDAIPDMLFTDATQATPGSSTLGAGPWFSFHGGVKTALVVFGTTLATHVYLELMARDGTTAIRVTDITVASLTILDLPPGSYRANLSGGSPSGVRAGLFACPHKK